MSEELIARLEKATEGSAELNEAIWDAVENRPRTVSCDHCGHWSVWFCPEYTRNLVEAVKIVPGDHEWSVGVDLENGKAWAQVGDDIWDESCVDITIFAPTPALALCIAALKARSAP